MNCTVPETRQEPLFKYNLLLTLVCISFFTANVIAQDIAYYTDHLGHFKVFEKGVILQAEHQPVSRIVVGGDYLFYQDDQENLIYYKNGTKDKISPNYPNKLIASRNFAITTFGGGTNVIYKGRLINLALRNSTLLQYSDSLIAFLSHDKYLNIFKDGFEREIEGPFDRSVTRSAFFKVSNNTLVYVDKGDRVQLVYNNETTEIRDVINGDFWVGTNLLAYVDEYEEFQLYDNESYMDLEEYPPLKVFASNDFVAYIDDENRFKIYYAGIVDEVDANDVDVIAVKDDIIVWTDGNGYLYYWKDGETTLLENYTPQNVKVDLNHIVYTDFDGRLKGIYDGEKVNYTETIVEGFDLFGNVLRYSINKRETSFYWKGETF